MKYLLLLLVVISSSVSAGEYDNSYVSINVYDKASGLYYRAVQDLSEGGGFLSSSSNVVTNINIFDPVTSTSRLLFKNPQKGGISPLLFESEIKDKQVTFDGTATFLAFNNSDIKRTELKNKLLVGVRNQETKTTTLFIADKNGSNLKQLTIVPPNTDWHIDVKNSKIRVVRKLENNVRIDSYDW
ncbi:hypothetical protein A7981_06530 [Methylovorus sp. MM2]|uniref:hypothetical protein n=1 Tax=Methylovorus sp. MM2 TaxID=1848038 RepID=UPI0007E09EF8|nr:hypothetical protein [Methylovorus sp. MM2]OAM53072.1 hypothetical protein A7981_06530 [Methylovorus sp. MM2]